MSFKLPPKVSSRKEMIAGCQTYTFRHEELGELGRLVLQGLPNGQCHISSEIIGDPNDPKTKEREAIFGPISRQLTDALEAIKGKGDMGGAPPPVSPQTGGEYVKSEIIPCDKCGAYVAMLIFSNAIEQGEFSDYARKMYSKYKEVNIPTWIVGGPAGGITHAAPDTPCNIMKVWPEQESIQAMPPEEFHKEIDALLESHCK